MPYNVTKKGDMFFVQSEGTGRVHGRHKTLAEARSQQKALYANAKDMMKGGSIKVHMTGEAKRATPSGEPGKGLMGVGRMGKGKGLEMRKKSNKYA